MAPDQPTDPHEAAQAEFSDYCDEELAPPARAALEAHLAGCAPCRAELDAFRRTLAAMRGAAAAPPAAPPEFLDDLKAQIHRRSRGRFFGQRRRGYRLELFSLVMLIVALTIYVALRMAQPLWLTP